MKSKHLKISQLLLLAFLVLSTGNTFAQNLQSLVGVRASSAENELIDRGYQFIKSDQSGEGIYAYWWKSSKRKCISVRTVDGRISAIVKTLPPDCGKNSNGGNDYSNYSNYNNHDSYEKGFQDGLHNRSYNAYGNSSDKREYGNGFSAGVAERHRNPDRNYGDYNGNNNNYYGSKIPTEDLKGWNAHNAYRELERRGFHKMYKDTYSQGRNVKTWYNSKTKQCRKTGEKNGRIDIIVDGKCN